MEKIIKAELLKDETLQYFIPDIILAADTSIIWVRMFYILL